MTTIARRAVTARNLWTRLSLALCAGLMAETCESAPEEIQVYEDELSEPGQFGVDVHNNFVVSGSHVPAYEGEQPPSHVFRLTPEFYYGVSKTVELGLYLLSTHTADGATHFDGPKMRVKFIAPHDSNAGLFWGANLEIGKTTRRVSETPWNAQIKGILGYRTGRWKWAVNPNIDWSLSSRGGPAAFGVDFKGAYAVTDRTQIGLESYNELGPLSGLQSLRQNSKSVFAVLDHEFDRFDVNVGIGRGLTTDADRWTLKAIVGTHF